MHLTELYELLIPYRTINSAPTYRWQFLWLLCYVIQYFLLYDICAPTQKTTSCIHIAVKSYSILTKI
jgi:hypothetical protein